MPSRPGSAWASAPYVVPFACFLVFLSVQRWVPPQIEYPLRLVLLAAVLLVFSRQVIDLHSYYRLQSVLIGLGVFVIWIAPDLLFPGYRTHWLFQNALLGNPTGVVPGNILSSPLLLWSRILRAAVLVPIIEELFWRAWLMRWLISPRFEKIPLGAFRASSFWITALLFASEHGPYWDVGLAAGIIYNWWMIRTKSLGDCILAHAVTNACLCGYVVATHRWEYWL